MFAPMLRHFPACQFVETTFAVDAATLYRLTMQYPLPTSLQQAVLKRQIEFLAGRCCARQAIARLTGETQVVIPQQDDRAPGWPPEIVGAITHTAGYAAALVAPQNVYDGIGLDCERIVSTEQLPLQRHICTPYELDTLHASCTTWSPEALLTLVFSAKESLYKCLYPRVQAYFGFEAARVVAVDVARGTFVVQLEKDVHPAWRTATQWTGIFACHRHLLMTAMAEDKRL